MIRSVAHFHHGAGLVRSLVGLAFSLACSACQDGGEGRNDFATSTAPEPCTPGEQRACACPGGRPDGVQVCDDLGERFDACMGCDADDDDGAESTAAAGVGESTGDASSDDGADGTPDPGASSSDGGPMPGWPSNPPQATPPAPPPDAFAVVEQTAIDHPDLLVASCVDTGGDNQFLYEVVRRLREQDDRWGLNWKRGVIGDMSQDVVDYHWGEGVSEESTDVYIIDIIVGHCGDDPQAGWIDVTGATLEQGEVGMWTLAGQDL
jgi:hypothetical protein